MPFPRAEAGPGAYPMGAALQNQHIYAESVPNKK